MPRAHRSERHRQQTLANRHRRRHHQPDQQCAAPDAHFRSPGTTWGLYKDSVVLLEQIRTIDKRRLREHMGHADESVMNQVDSAIAVSFGLTGI